MCDLTMRCLGTAQLINIEQAKSPQIEPENGRQSVEVLVKDSAVTGRTVIVRQPIPIDFDRLKEAVLQQLKLPSKLQVSLVQDGKALPAQNQVCLAGQKTVILLLKSSLIGGMKSSKRTIIHTSNETEPVDNDDDDHFKRVKKDHDEVVSQPSTRNLVAQDTKFERPKELDEISADELARLVKGDQPGTINLTHSAFTHPRNHWEKILSSPEFDDIAELERFRLQAFIQSGSNPKNNQEMSQIAQNDDKLAELEREVDNPLVCQLPTLKYLDVKARVRDGQTQYLVLVELTRDLAKSFYVDLQKGQLEGQVRETSGAKKSTNYQLQKFLFDSKQKQLVFEKMLPVDKLVPYAQQIEHDSAEIENEYYMLQGARSEIVYFTKLEEDGNQTLYIQVMTNQQDKPQSLEVSPNSNLYNFMLEEVVFEKNVFNEFIKRSFIRKSRPVAPQVHNIGEAGLMLSYTHLDASYDFSVWLYSLKQNTEIVKVQGAQALLCPMTDCSQYQISQGKQSFLFYADPLQNEAIKQNDKEEYKDRIFYTEFFKELMQNFPNKEKQIYAQAKVVELNPSSRQELQVIDVRLSLDREEVTSFDERKHESWRAGLLDECGKASRIFYNNQECARIIELEVDGKSAFSLSKIDSGFSVAYFIDQEGKLQKIVPPHLKQQNQSKPIVSQSQRVSHWLSTECNFNGGQEKCVVRKSTNLIEEQILCVTNQSTDNVPEPTAYALDPELGQVVKVGAYGGTLKAHILEDQIANKPESFDKIDPRKSWQTQVCYPLVVMRNKHLQNRVYVYSMLERNLAVEGDKAALIKFTFPYEIMVVADKASRDNFEHGHLTKIDILFCINLKDKQLEEDEPGNAELIRQFGRNAQKLTSCCLLLEEAYQHGAVLKEENWLVRSRDSFVDNNALQKQWASWIQPPLKHEPKEFDFMAEITNERTILICSIASCFFAFYNEDRIFWLNMLENRVAVIYESTEKRKLSSIRPTYCGGDKFYFVEKDVELQIDHIRSIKIHNEGLITCLIYCNIEYTMEESDVIAMQICNDSLQLSDYQKNQLNWLLIYEGFDITRPQELFVLDANMNLTKLREKTGDKSKRERTRLEKVESRSLSWHRYLKQEMQINAVRESICITDRAIIQRGIVISLNSNQKFQAFSRQDLQKKYEFIAGFHEMEQTPVPSGNAILYYSVKYGELIMQADPSRRGLIFGHAMFFRHVRYHVQISPNLLLFEFHSTLVLTSREERKKRNLWTLITTSGQLVDLPQSFVNIIEDPGYDPCCKKDFLQIPGGLTQIVFSPPDKQNGEIVVRLNSECEVVSVQRFASKPINSVLLQNCIGELLQVMTSEQGDLFEFEDRKDMPPLLKCGELTEKHELIFLKDFLCIRKDSPATCAEVRVFSLKEKSYSRLPLKLSIVDFEIVCTAQACNPLIQLQQLRLDDIGEIEFTKLTNRMQVTTSNHTCLLQVHFDTEGNYESRTKKYCPANQSEQKDSVKFVDQRAPFCDMLSTELTGTEKLLNPNLFVETGMSIQLVQPFCYNKIDAQMCGKKMSLQTLPFGEVVALSQNLVNVYPKCNPQSVRLPRPLVGLYKKHARMDFEGMKLLLSDSQLIAGDPFDQDIIYAQLGQTSVLDIALKDLPKSKLIFKQFEDRYDEDADPEDPNLLRLAKKLTEKSMIFDEARKKISTHSCISKRFSDTSARDVCLKIGQLCPSFTVFTELVNQENFESLTSTLTQTLIQEFNNCFKMTNCTNELNQMKWTEDLDMHTSMQESCSIMPAWYGEEMEKTSTDERSLIEKNVSVQVLDLEWFYDGGQNFITFSQQLQNLPSSVYASEFVSSMLQQNWAEIQSEIIRKFFIIYLVYAFSSITYMKLALSADREEDGTANALGMTILCLVTLALWIRQTYIEVFQVREDGINYFTQLWNLVDFTGLLIVLLILAHTGLRIDLISIEALRILAAIASCLTLLKLFDWLRLFEDTAFYVLLVFETLKDIRHFLFLLLTTLMMFGVPMLMLDANSSDGKEVIEETFGFWLADLIYNQYLLALGEFGMDNFGDHPQSLLIYMIFFLATFFSQLTMLNMLIAIMGDSFDKVIENKEVNSIKMKLAILSDLSAVLSNVDKGEHKAKHLLLVKQTDVSEDGGDDWEGTIKRLTRVVERQGRLVRSRLDSKVDKLQSSFEDFVRKEAIQERQLQAHIDAGLKRNRDEVQAFREEMLALMKPKDE